MSAFARAGSKGEINWRTHSDAVWEIAKKEGKPVLLEVWADWCAPCKAMDREVWSDQRIVDLSKKFVCVSLDMSRQNAIYAESIVFGSHGRYPVKVFPTILLLDPWREMLLFSEGYIHAKELAAILNEVPRDYNPVRTPREALNSDRNNSRALTRVGELYDQSTAFGIANRYYTEALTSRAPRKTMLFAKISHTGSR